MKRESEVDTKYGPFFEALEREDQRLIHAQLVRLSNKVYV